MNEGGKDLRILITGGSGFIGTNLISYLRRELPQATVQNLDSEAPRNESHFDVWQSSDLRDTSRVQEEFDFFAPTHLLHLGARTDLNGGSVQDYEANTKGVEAIVRAANRSTTLQRAVYFSSRLVCKIGYSPRSDDDYCPPNAYGESKVQGERIVRALARHEWVILRPTSIWGPWFGVPYRDFFDSVLHGRYVQIGSRPIPKSFGFVGNTVHQVLAVMLCDTGLVAGRTLYLGDYPPLEVSDFASRIRRASGKKPLARLPEWSLRPVALAGDLLAGLGWKSVPLTSFRLNNLLTPMVYDLTSLRRVAGDLPHSLDEGIEETLDWLREHDDL